LNSNVLTWLDSLQEGGEAPTLLGPVLVRLLMALLLGAVVAQIYRRTAQHADTGASFPVTLILLSVLIAMVTQVIGSNVARAFSLVGALSVVRFRTVVRDTRDTAYVIFAVVVGMAVGSANLTVAIVGLVIIAVASWLIHVTGCFGFRNTHFVLRVRGSIGNDPSVLAAPVFAQHLSQHELISIANSRQGVGLDYSYTVTLRENSDVLQLVNALSAVTGIQDVRCERRDEL
jgi:hypothetical protein